MSNLIVSPYNERKNMIDDECDVHYPVDASHFMASSCVALQQSKRATSESLIVTMGYIASGPPHCFS